MKRAAIFVLCAFYLLLTSGMYVCAVHCSVAEIVAKPAMQMACSKPCCKQSANNKDHNCGKKHGSFTIKENVKPGYQIRFNLPLLTLQLVPVTGYRLNAVPVAYNAPYLNSKAPPGASGKIIIIQFRSLLI